MQLQVGKLSASCTHEPARAVHISYASGCCHKKKLAAVQGHIAASFMHKSWHDVQLSITCLND